MNDEDDLGRVVIDVGDDLTDESAYDALLEPRVGCWGRPDGLKIVGQGGERG